MGQRRDPTGDHRQLVHTPSDALHDIGDGRRIGQPCSEQAAKVHHRRSAGPGTDRTRGRHHRRTQHRAHRGRQYRRNHRQLRMATGLQYEDGTGEADEADPQIRPERGLVTE